MDGNVLRVISRVLASRSDIADARTKKSMEAALAAIMPRDCAGDFNQALMELGATVCLPNGEPLVKLPAFTVMQGKRGKPDRRNSRQGGKKETADRSAHHIYPFKRGTRRPQKAG